MTDKLKKYGIDTPIMVTWFFQFIVIFMLVYGFYFRVNHHINNKNVHLSFKEKLEIRNQLSSIENKIGNQETYIKLTVRETIAELKKEGVIK